jgi:hypothetical protein
MLEHPRLIVLRPAHKCIVIHPLVEPLLTDMCKGHPPTATNTPQWQVVSGGQQNAKR